MVTTLIIALSLSGCGPTYPRDKIEQGIRELCRKEHQIDVNARLVGRTLYVFLEANNLLDESLRMGEKAFDILEKTLLSTTRVTLSSDANIEFYVVVVEDHIRRIEMMFIQNIADIKRFIFRQISRDDYFTRLVIRVNVKKAGDQWLSQNESLVEMDTPQFLAQQVVWKVRREIEGNLLLRFVLNTEDITGVYNGLHRKFTFTITERPSKLKKSGNWQDDVLLDLIMENTVDTCKKYKFDNYRYVEVMNGQSLTFTKEEMERRVAEKKIKKDIKKFGKDNK